MEKWEWNDFRCISASGSNLLKQVGVKFYYIFIKKLFVVQNFEIALNSRLNMINPWTYNKLVTLGKTLSTPVKNNNQNVR